MAAGSHYVAIDLGAESGRVIAGTLRDGRVSLEELHRFENVPLRGASGLHWDLPLIQQSILSGLRLAGQRYGGDLAGIGVDTWGVDYGLLDAAGKLLGAPVHYRNARTDGLRERAALRVPPAEQFSRTGIALLPFNTIYQLMAEADAPDRMLDRAASLLLMPDLLHHWLSGAQANELTDASTSGALGVDGQWATDLLSRLDLPSHMLCSLVQPGTVLGTLRRAIGEQCSLGSVPIVAPATHDTASAVVAVPARSTSGDATHAYISSGTWSLLGLELERPVLSEQARLAGFTNERGAAGSFRFLTNIMGLWLVQECRRIWARAGSPTTYAELTAQAAMALSPDVVIDVDDAGFLHPDDMAAAIADQLRRTDQQMPNDDVALVRAILEGLALKYRLAVEQAEQLTGMRVETVHVVGGGSRNALLCQLTADACGRAVLAGPAEATALGNVLVQAMGRGEIRDLAEARAITRASLELTGYEPRSGIDWEERRARLAAHRQKALSAGDLHTA